MLCVVSMDTGHVTTARCLIGQSINRDTFLPHTRTYTLVHTMYTLPACLVYTCPTCAVGYTKGHIVDFQRSEDKVRTSRIEVAGEVLGHSNRN